MLYEYNQHVLPCNLFLFPLHLPKLICSEFVVNYLFSLAEMFSVDIIILLYTNQTLLNLDYVLLSVSPTYLQTQSEVAMIIPTFQSA